VTTYHHHNGDVPLKSNCHLRTLAIYQEIVTARKTCTVVTDDVVDVINALMPAEYTAVLVNFVHGGTVYDVDVSKSSRKIMRRLQNVGLVKTNKTAWTINGDHVHFLRNLASLYAAFAERFRGDDWQHVQCEKVVAWFDEAGE